MTKKIIKKLKTIKKKPVVSNVVEVDIDATGEKVVGVKTYEQLNGMNLLTGEKALLLAEACKLDRQKKLAEKRLKVIKEDLDINTKGEYTNKAGDVVKVSVVPKKSDIDPMELQKKLKKQKKEGKFWSCVKVQLTPLKKVLVDSDIESMQFDLDPTIKKSFK